LNHAVAFSFPDFFRREKKREDKTRAEKEGSATLNDKAHPLIALVTFSKEW